MFWLRNKKIFFDYTLISRSLQFWRLNDVLGNRKKVFDIEQFICD